MSNILLGIITLVICCAGYLFSGWNWKKGKTKTAIIFLLFCGLILRFFVATDFFLHDWDERYHALVAKHLILHPLIPTLYDNPILPFDYKNWLGNNVWLHKQPFPLWMMALSMWLFGTNEIALRLPSIILSTIGIFLTYRIGKYFFNKNIGYLAAFFYSVNGLILELTGGRVATDHIDIFFLFFIELAIFLSILFSRKKIIIFNVLTGISIGIAILCKWLPAFIVIPIWLLIVFDSSNFARKEIISHFLIMLITCFFLLLIQKCKVIYYLHHQPYF